MNRKLCPITKWTDDRGCKKELCACYIASLGVCGLIAVGYLQSRELEQAEWRADKKAVKQ
jgi:hypothetical protein